MLCVVDYGVGNLYSLCSSLKAVGADAVVSGDPEVIAKADKIILPGVGAFGDAAAKLRENGLDKLIIERANAGVPLMGICLGMQLSVIEFARNVAGLRGANSTEFEENSNMFGTYATINLFSDTDAFL